MDFLDKALLSYQQIEKLEQPKHYELLKVQCPHTVLRQSATGDHEWKDGVRIGDTPDPLRRLLGRVLPIWLLSDKDLRDWITHCELRG
jgi:hypothetical protein